MDGLIAFGFLILVAIIAAPIIALVALSRSNQAKYAISQLKQQVEELQKKLANAQYKDEAAEPLAPAPIEALVTEEPVAPPPERAANAYSIPQPQFEAEVISSSIAPMVSEPVPQTSTAQTTAPQESFTPAADSSNDEVKAASNKVVTPSTSVAKSTDNDLFSGLIHWFFKENPVAKLGILLLFFGLAYLMKYTIDRDMFPIELRLASAALISIVLLGLGWRLRHKQPLYGLILQGGAVGALYITVFAAFRLYLLLPHMFAFGLMLLICAASVGLAVLQRALSLAMLASIGGYLSPILLSTGSANHVGLFSYYLLISSGILVIAVWQSWRVLNLLGFVFTFGVATIWGMEYYRPEYYLSCQLFLLANLILFSLLAELFAVKNRIQQHMAIDGTLLFGPPLIGFAMQYAITSHWAFGPAFSALGFGLIYLVITWGTLRRFPLDGKRIATGYLALGGCFVTLAIPLALSAQWTALAWSLEGLGILWFGLLQNQRRLSWSGSALLVLALGSQLVAYTDYLWGISLVLVLPVVFLCFISAGALWRHYKPQHSPWQVLSLGMLMVGIAVWGWWLAEMPAYFYMRTYDLQPVLLSLLGFSLSVWIWRQAGQRLDWRELKQTVWLLWPVASFILLIQLQGSSHPLEMGWWNLSWLSVIVSAAFLLFKDASKLLPMILEKGAHLLLFWLVLILAGSEILWRISELSWGMSEWRFYLFMCSLSLVILLLWIAERRQAWPIKTHGDVYWLGCIPLVLSMMIMLLTGNMMDGQMVNWTYVPLVNPLEEAAIFGILMLAVWLRRTSSLMGQFAPQFDVLVHWIIWAIAAWWLNGMLLRALAYYADVPWWLNSLWASRLIQATFAIVWTLIALVCMIYSTRIARRTLWFTGAAVLGVVIVKLFLVDSAQGGGLARAIAFIGVAILLLVVGYVSPLPPRPSIEQESKA
ncbi:Predicted membrane protein [Pragia fontium]|uniref:DUF2339 domain-containing protein n=1 Tax=Pragia fontium TaxID=82985 RepID=UPI000DFA03BE|nr:DUF2339 domain-containing protein [Pragia fontium]SUB83649.1 Predicted membrane protein [Pragia fontium]